MAANVVGSDSVWLEKSRFDDAETYYYEKLAGNRPHGQQKESGDNKVAQEKEGKESSRGKEEEDQQRDQLQPQTNQREPRNQEPQKSQQREPRAAQEAQSSHTSQAKSCLVSEIVRAREQIKLTLESGGADSVGRVEKLEAENVELKKTVAELVARLSKLEVRVTSFEANKSGAGNAKPQEKKAPEPQSNGGNDDDDDVDLFGSDDEADGEADKLREKRISEYAAKKAKKPGVIAKSSVVLEVKPWDDETDLKEMEKVVRSIQLDGLVWGASKFVPIAYNIKKLQIVCVVEDDKIGIEDLSEKIQEFEDFVQSVDIAAFNKI